MAPPALELAVLVVSNPGATVLRYLALRTRGFARRRPAIRGPASRQVPTARGAAA